MDKVNIRVEGMTCGGCVSSIQKALTARNGVEIVSGSVADKTVTVDFDPAIIGQADLESAIEQAGFDVVK